MKVEGMLELQNHQLFWGRTKKLIKQEWPKDDKWVEKICRVIYRVSKYEPHGVEYSYLENLHRILTSFHKFDIMSKLKVMKQAADSILFSKDDNWVNKVNSHIHVPDNLNF
jgi:hypothetical protein